MRVHPGTDRMNLFLKSKEHSTVESKGSNWMMGGPSWSEKKRFMEICKVETLALDY